MAPDENLSPEEKTSNDKNADNKPNFMGIPIRGWAIAAVSFVLVLFAIGHFGFKLYGDWQEALKEKANLAVKAEKAAAVNQDTSSYANAVTKEMDLHKHDGSGHRFTLHSGKYGLTVATFFDSDGCIAIARPGVPLPYLPAPQSILEWSLAPDRRPSSKPPAEALPLGASMSTPTSMSHPSGTQYSRAANVLRVSETIDEVSEQPEGRLIRVQGACWMNGPHPWQFGTWWGPANGCWAPLYRRWNDGCTHYQMFNTCNGQWDPQIYWTFCNPQHHP